MLTVTYYHYGVLVFYIEIKIFRNTVYTATINKGRA